MIIRVWVSYTMLFVWIGLNSEGFVKSIQFVNKQLRVLEMNILIQQAVNKENAGFPTNPMSIRAHESSPTPRETNEPRI